MSTPAAAQFNAVADAYVTSAVHARGSDLRALTAALDAAEHWSVLDVGCGAGHASLAAANHVRQVTAVDIAERMLEASAALAATQGLRNITFLQSSADHLPFDDRSFDGAFTRLSGHHWPDPAGGIAELVRVVKPGAPCVLIDTVGFDELPLDTFLNALELLRDPSHARNGTVREWSTYLERAGCEIERIERWTIDLVTEEWLRRSATVGWRAAACRGMLAEAPAEAYQSLNISEQGKTFELPAALILARRAAR